MSSDKISEWVKILLPLVLACGTLWGQIVLAEHRISELEKDVSVMQVSWLSPEDIKRRQERLRRMDENIQKLMVEVGKLNAD